MKSNIYSFFITFRIFLATIFFSIGLITNANAQEDYGDLVFLHRNASGVPILDSNSCRQPIAFESDTCPLVCSLEPCLVPLAGLSEENPCEIEAGYEACAKEVEFGRVNVGRAPDEIFDRQLADVEENLTTADCQTLDPAGRMAAIRVDEDLGTTLASTIDSPLQNLAIYRELMLMGKLDFPIPQGGKVMETAARGLGAAFGKSDEVTVDTLVYINQIMDLSDKDTETILDKICIDINEEVLGEMQLVEHCFLDYTTSGYAYTYERADNFSTTATSLPKPAYMPAASPLNGVFEYLTQIEFPYIPIPLFSISTGPILDAVFCVDSSSGDPVVLYYEDGGVCPEEVDLGFVGDNIAGFTQAVDDTRAVINFMHSNQVPDSHVTPVPCSASASELFFPIVTPDGKAAVIILRSYDFDISGISGITMK